MSTVPASASSAIEAVADSRGHVCAARGCEVRLQPGVTFCKRHWRWVPQLVQRRIARFWREWKAGSVVAPDEWRRAVTEAVEYIANVERGTVTPVRTDPACEAPRGGWPT